MVLIDNPQDLVIGVLGHVVWPDGEPGYPLSPVGTDKFERFVRDLVYRGFHFCSQQDIYDMYVNGKQLPFRNIWLNFDDGFESTLLYASPILEKYGARATVFPEFNKLGDIYRLSEAQIVELHETGIWDIGTHGYYGHGGDFAPPYNVADYSGGLIYNDRLTINAEGRQMTDEEYKDLVRADLKYCQDKVKELTGQRCTTFVYPGGSIGLYGNDPENIPRLNFEVMDELGIVGFPVSGEDITSVNTRHLGKRPAWTSYSEIDEITVYGSSVGTVIISMLTVGDKYLVGLSNSTLRWMNKDLTWDGDAFILTGFGYPMGGHEKLAQDPYTGKYWLADNFYVMDFDPHSREYLGLYAHGGAELCGVYFDENYIYAISKGGTVRRSDKEDLRFTAVGTLEGAEAWAHLPVPYLLNGVLYVKHNKNYCMVGYDPTNFKIVERIFLPTESWNTGAIFCPNGELYSDWFLHNSHRLAKMKIIY